MGHRRRHFLIDRHLLLDRTLHANQPDPELVLQQLADRPHAAVAEMIDVIHVRRIAPQLQQVANHFVEVPRAEHFLVERGVESELRVQLQPSHAREVVLLRVEEHAFEQRAGTLLGRRVARPQAPVDLDERFLRGADQVFLQRRRQPVAQFVAFGEENLDLIDLLLLGLGNDARRHLLVHLKQHLAGRRIDDVGRRAGAIQFFLLDFHPLDARGLQPAAGHLGDALAAPEDRRTVRCADVGRRAQTDELRTDSPAQRPILDGDALHVVELPDDLRRALESERAQEHRGEELALAVDPDVEQILGVVLELHPGTAVRNDLGLQRPRVVGILFGMEERARRTVELRDDDPLGSVDDEGAVVGHQGDVTEIDFLFLDVADRPGVRVGILVPDDKPDGDLQGHGVRHAALLALLDVVVQLDVDTRAADVADLASHAVGVTACRTTDFVLFENLQLQRDVALRAGPAQVVETRQPPALALPASDGIVDELQRRVLAEVADRKDRLEDGLQPDLVALGRQPVHLQKAFVRFLLDLYQVGNRNGGANLREVDALAVYVL